MSLFNRFAFLFFLLAHSMSASAASSQTCFAHEENPITKKVFSSNLEYQQELNFWKSKNPGLANPIQLAFAYKVYRSDRTYAESLGSDKMSHCYLGCRISQETDYRTAEYVGWLKEDRDLKDCDLSSHYEEADFLATIAGAQYGQSAQNANDCVLACQRF